MNDAEKWSQYNRAEQALSILISNFSARMFAEKKGDSPDLAQIQNWKTERAELMKISRALRVDDMATIERVIETYAPRAKEITQKG